MLKASYSDRESGFNCRQELLDSLAFADKYAGFHASPDRAPGAWIALGESDAVADATNTRQRLKIFNGDFTYLMERLPDKSLGVNNIGPDHIRFGAYARRLPPLETMRLKVNDRFLNSLRSGCRLNVIYFDDQPGIGFTVSGSGQSWKVPMRGGNAWAIASFEITSPAFRGAVDGAHLRIQNANSPVCLHLVEVERK